jgi:hypothetical protein
MLDTVFHSRDLPRLTGFVPNNILARVAEATIDRPVRASDPGARVTTARSADKVLNGAKFLVVAP